MDATTDRIEKFRTMADANPNDELAHYSLGQTYLDAGMWPEATASFERVLEINPRLSKTYQLLGDALLKQNRKEDAITRLTAGVKMADERGDRMPRDAMVKTLQGLGAPAPELKVREQQVVSEGQVACQRCGRIAGKLPKQPMRNDLGKQIYEMICIDCWKEWIGMGTKVINELRLPLSDPQAQKIYDQHMKEFLNLQ